MSHFNYQVSLVREALNKRAKAGTYCSLGGFSIPKKKAIQSVFTKEKSCVLKVVFTFLRIIAVVLVDKQYQTYFAGRSQQACN